MLDAKITVRDIVLTLTVAAVAYVGVTVHRIDAGLARAIPALAEQVARAEAASTDRIDGAIEGIAVLNEKADRLDLVQNALVEVHYTNPLCR